MQPKISVNIGKLKLSNPVMVASGTFGYGQEFKDFMNLKSLGAIVTKTVTLKPRKGNPSPRTCETPAGMLNSIGLENPGVAVFLNEKLPVLKKIGVPVIVSIASEGGAGEFLDIAKLLDKNKEVAAIELNISCPNIRSPKLIAHNSGLISQNAKATYELVRKVRKATSKTLITKLSPNVTDITEIAIAAERAGSDAVSLINTLIGLGVDINTRKPKIAMVCGGLSGPAIRPIAVRMCWEVFNKIKIPIIGMGGIMNASSALEFFIAGATAVSVGTANFVDPGISEDIVGDIKKYLIKNKISNIKDITGSLKI